MAMGGSIGTFGPWDRTQQDLLLTVVTDNMQCIAETPSSFRDRGAWGSFDTVPYTQKFDCTNTETAASGTHELRSARNRIANLCFI